MNKDIGRYTFHINRHYLTNFAIGLDYYRIYDKESNTHEASICQFNLLLFNITITRWHRWI